MTYIDFWVMGSYDRGGKNIYGSFQDCSNSIANALELPQICTKP